MQSITHRCHQIWTQLVTKKTRLSTFTTSEVLVFTLRGEGEEDDTLFMSPEYTYKECPILATTAWFALGAGLLKLEDLELPKVNTEWWEDKPAITQFTGTGIAPAYVQSEFTNDFQF